MKKNTRSLSDIAVDIHALERRSIIDIGELLIEAQGQCEPGKWLAWLGAEFEWSVDTAGRYMSVAKLAGRFRKLRNLKLGKTTLYDLAYFHEEEDMPAIIAELAKHATKSWLAPSDADRVIQIGIGRRRFGDYPDVTLERLSTLSDDSPRHAKLIAALKEQKPATHEAADAIVLDIRRQYEADAKADAEAQAAAEADEAAAILDGPPPMLPAAAPREDHQPLPCDTPDVDVSDFVDAVQSLCRLSTRAPARKLAHAVLLHDLGTAHDLIEAVLTAARAREAAPADA
jgi:hypothetical protein